MDNSKLKRKVERLEREHIITSVSKDVGKKISPIHSAIASTTNAIVAGFRSLNTSVESITKHVDQSEQRIIEDLSDRVSGIQDAIPGATDTKPLEVELKSIKGDISDLKEVIKKKDFRGPKGDSVKGDSGKDGEPGKDGKNGHPGKQGEPGLDGSDGTDGKDGKDGSPDTPGEVRDKLSTLKGKKRLHADSIQGLKKYMSTSTNIIGGASTHGLIYKVETSTTGVVISDDVGVHVCNGTVDYNLVMPAGVTGKQIKSLIKGLRV